MIDTLISSCVPKADPVTITVPPGDALLTVMPTVTVKLDGLAAVPPGVVTVTGPEVAKEGTVALMYVPPGSTLLIEAFVPLNCTTVAPVSCVPVM